MPRRILLLITDLEIGGTPTVVRELATRLSGDDVHVEVASLKTRGPVGAELVNAGIDVTALNARSVFELALVARRLRRLIVEHQIDTVVSFLVHANVVATLAVPTGVRLIQSIQTTQPRPAWHWLAQQLVANKAERIVVPSPSVVAVAGERAGIERDRFVVIPNAIDPDAFPRSPAPPTPYPVGFIGRLDPVKRIGDLIEAVRSMPDVSLTIFGDGSERQRLNGDKVNFAGAIARPQDALARIGLLVLPSEAEGFGLVLIEAMAAGVPVIGTNVPGIRDVIQDGVNGLLVPVARPADLRAAIDRVVRDRDLRARLIEGGLRTVRERYTWDVVLPQYRALLGLEG